MNEFLIQLQAKLDEAKSKGNVNADIDKLQGQLDNLKIQATLDPKSAQNLADEIGKLVNQKIVISNIGIDQNNIAKPIQQVGKQIENTITQSVQNGISNANKSLKSFSELKIGTGNIDAIINEEGIVDVEQSLSRIKEFYSEFGQVKITDKIFDSDGSIQKFKVNIEQVNGELKETRSFMMALNGTSFAFPNDIIKGSESIVQHLDKTKNVINATGQAINELANKSKIDKIQFSIDTGETGSKVDALIAKTQQWTDSEGNARISTQALTNSLNELCAASNDYLKVPTEENQKRIIDANQKLDIEYKKITSDVRTMNAEFAKNSAIDTLRQKYQKFYDDNSKAHRQFGAEIKAAMNELSQGAEIPKTRLEELKQRLVEIGNQAKVSGQLGQNFIQGIISKVKSLTAYVSGAMIVSKVFSAIKEGTGTVSDLITALVDLKKTANMTAGQLREFYYSANDVAKQMGVTTKQIIEQAAAWSRLGFNTAEAATKMAKYSSMFKMISPGMDLDSATDGLVSVMKAFKIGLEDTDEVVDGIMSKINIIGNTQALNNADIVDFLTRSSSAMAEANNSLEETIALGTAAVEITRDAASVGNALKTVSMRIRGYDEETEEFIGNVEQLSGEIADLTKTASTPGGISLFSDAAKTEYKSTKQLFDDIAEIYHELTDKNQADLLEILAGKRQGQIVGSILNNYETVKNSMDSMANSAGNAEAEMSIAMESIDYKLNQVKETGTGIAQNLFKQEDMNKVISILLSFMEVIDKTTEKIGLFGTVMASAGGFGIFKFVKNLDRQKVLKEFPRFFKRSNIEKEMIRWFKVQIYAFGSFKINQRGVIAGTDAHEYSTKAELVTIYVNVRKAEKTEYSIYGNLYANAKCA